MKHLGNPDLILFFTVGWLQCLKTFIALLKVAESFTPEIEKQDK